MGTLDAVAKFFTNKFPVIEHPECIHTGGSQCRYVITWEETASMKWRLARNYLSVALLLLFIVFCFFLPLSYLGLIGAVMTLIVLGISGLAFNLERKDLYERLEQNSDVASKLLEQISTNYNNTLVVQEVGKAVSSVLDIDELLSLISNVLKTRLPFDRGMIMLSNPERTRLVYACGYGASPELEVTLKKAFFHLDDPSSKGPFVKAFREQKPVFVNDIKDMIGDISARSRDLLASLGADSFICVPIVFNGISEGILAVDNHKSRKGLNQSQVNILSTIADQIAISLNNARIHYSLKESEERFRSLSENSPDIIYTTNKNRQVTYINPSFKEILGYSTEDMLGKDFLDIVEENNKAELASLIEDVCKKNKRVRHYEGKLITEEGKTRLFDMNISSNVELNSTGEIIGVIGTLKDITQQRELEKQLSQTSKMDAIGGLAGGVSHDLNNILQAVTSYAEILKRKTAESGGDSKLIVNIQELAKRGKDIVNQLLIFSREVESKPVALSLNIEIKKYYELMLGIFPKNITIKLKLADCPKQIIADPTQIGQVFMNLAVNARDAMPEGGELTVETRNMEFNEAFLNDGIKIGTGSYVIMRVSDTGIGIEKNNLERIFEPFFTTKGFGKGSGIGLAVVYGIVKKHGGQIACQSKLGEGTVFTVYFPASEGPCADEQKEKEVTNYAEVPGHETILLVDDEPSLLETGEGLLSYLGYNVLTASSGEEAFDLVKRERGRIDIVIMDLMMPGIGGLKSLERMLEVFPKMKAIIASGLMDAASSQSIIKSGAAAFIKKPYDIEELNKKIRQILDAPVQPL
jgi:PAS domain S-box-containing protein